MRALLSIAAALAWAACDGGMIGAGGNGLAVQTSVLAVQPVAWNSARVPTGKVAAAVEVYDDVAVFGDQGLQVFTSGALLAGDATIKKWQAAALVPAGDRSGDWAVGVAADGRLWRVRDRSTVEEVTGRYGLAGTPVRAVASLGQGLTGFAYDQGLAVADGEQVTRFDGSFAGLVGGGGRAAVVAQDSLRVLSIKDGQSRTYPLPGVVAAAFDPAGTLLVATADRLYQQVGDDLHLLYQADAPLRALVGTPAGVWVQIGDALALLSGNELRRAPAGTLTGAAAGGARLLPSASGDVWVLAGGALSRFAAVDGAAADQDQWQRDVQPLFSRLCAVCHLPGGSSGIDLSSYAAWASRRALIQQRVISGKPTPMPPAGAGKLTSDETNKLKAWLASKP